MPRRTPEHTRLLPRRLPQQDRSQKLVDAIKQAALELAAQRGFAKLSTADIAERAGVGKGSFYDYFSAREGVFMALYEEASVLLTMEMRKLHLNVLDLEPRLGVRRAIRRHLALIRDHKLVLVDLGREVPELRDRMELVSYESTAATSTLLALQKYCPHLSARELERRSFLTQLTTRYSIEEYLLRRPRAYNDRLFVDNLSRMILKYLDLPD